MTAPLSNRKQMKIIELFFQAYSYDKIANYANVGKGSVEEVIRRLRTGEYQEFQDVVDLVDTLREIAIFIRKHFDGDVSRCHVGSVAWVCLNRLGVEPSQVKDWAEMCESLAPDEMQTREFVQIAVWCWRVKEQIGVDFLDLPKYVESLQGKVNALHGDIEAFKTERNALQSQVKAAKGSIESSRAELGLLQDIEGIRETRREEESQLAEAEGRTRSALTNAKITLEDLERFRVLEGVAKAKGVPLDSDLFETLLDLVASLGPSGIRRLQRLAEFLAKEGLGYEEGIALLVGLWKRGFTLRRATTVVSALNTRGSFSSALNELISLLSDYGSAGAAIADKTQRLEKLKQQEAAKRGELSQLEKNLSMVQAGLASVSLQAKEAANIRDRTREENQTLLTQRTTELEILQAELLRTKETLQDTKAKTAAMLETRASTEKILTSLNKKREEAAELRALISALGRNLVLLVRKTQELAGPIQIAAYVPALIQGHKGGLRVLVEAAKLGVLGEMTAKEPWVSETAAKWLQEELIRAQEGALVSVKDHDRLRKAKDEEIASLKIDVEHGRREVEAERDRGRTSLAEAEKRFGADRQSLSRLRSQALSTGQTRLQLEEKCRKLREKVSILGKVLPSVGEKRFGSVDEFYEATKKIMRDEAISLATEYYRTWQRKEMAAGRLVVVGQHNRQLICPSGHQFDVPVTSRYLAEVISGARSGALLPIARRPGVVIETCPKCGRRTEATLDQLVG